MGPSPTSRARRRFHGPVTALSKAKAHIYGDGPTKKWRKIIWACYRWNFRKIKTSRFLYTLGASFSAKENTTSQFLSFIHSFIQSFIHLVIHSSIHPYTYSSICTTINQSINKNYRNFVNESVQLHATWYDCSFDFNHISLFFEVLTILTENNEVKYMVNQYLYNHNDVFFRILDYTGPWKKNLLE